ncbi:MAG TPA: glycosyltransferase [Phycisphaerales bacterium]|nr:glycosyltransferase [Phycisphaerales bacterium]
MKLVIFGLTMSSSWGNGHATLWRALCRALARRHCHIVFFERDVHYYAAHRDLPSGIDECCELCLYPSLDEIAPYARSHLADADVAIVTSYCPDGIAAAEMALSSAARLRVFYDLDTPVTLDRLRSGEELSYIGPRGLADYDLVLSYTGGAALDALRTDLGARRVAPLYGSVDPDAHKPVDADPAYRSDLSYLGTYAADRQAALEALFVEPARRLPRRKFLIGGAQYPQEFPWTSNIFFVRHMPPGLHPAFFSSSRLTLNVTRRAMAEMGYCPSGRLFEAAACGAPVLTDWWEGLDAFFQPGEEVLIARTAADAVAAVETSDAELARIARAARQRTLEQHTADRRAGDLLDALERAASDGADAPVGCADDNRTREG